MPEQDDIKMPLTSASPLEERKEALKELFPEVFTEESIDLEKLRLALGEDMALGRERYGLSWAGKSDAVRAVQIPSIGTLVPDRKESVNFDSTENLFIEGDNLEVLKLLQKSYYGKIKMIYIDPPYNTGNDFIYPDNFREGLHDYLVYTSQADAEGTRLTTEIEKSGRIHSNWLNMMYPRLFLARNLLCEDGVISVSIDEHEIHNLTSLLCEIFGEENHIGTIIWKGSTDNNPTRIAIEHEYIVFFARDIAKTKTPWKNRGEAAKISMLSEYDRLRDKFGDNTDAIQDYFRKFVKANRESLAPLTHYDRVDERGVYTGSRKVHNPHPGGYNYDVTHPVTKQVCIPPANGYRYPKATMDSLLKDNRILFGEDEKQIIQIKEYLRDYEGKLSSVIFLDSRAGSNELANLFNKRNIFTNPKPSILLATLFDFCLEKDDLLLDFFSGSSSAAHAIIEMNHADGGNRHFIMIQLPEPTDEGSIPFNAGYKTIADIGKERIRRVINKIEGNDKAKLAFDKSKKTEDLGLRIFKLAASNFKIWESDEAPAEKDELANQLKLFADHVIEGRPEEAVLYELILKSGLPLTSKIKEGNVANKKVYIVGEGEERLVICLEKELPQEALRAMIELEPRRVLCLDNAFMGNDQLKTNIVLEMKSHHIQFRAV